ncbi:SAM-dependent methyltransferase [Nocardiopsis sp. EMB25]|uniref:N-6 DNA methylase n=1 Tax=Nocardiopsis sp. EMB25 TaxID=2835867 RepID=UPI0022849C89|nr:N-6 DNA methylase [Nocardiopsis sp. EMB25]MCY9784196.1 SAM-dependent methyltransferase [Nocardiopsis sp. EMB25]
MNDIWTVDEQADELLRAKERLAGRGDLDAARAIAAMLVLGGAPDGTSILFDSWDDGRRTTRLDRVVATAFERPARALRSEWEQWREEEDDAGLFPDTVPFTDFPEARLAEAVRAVHGLLRQTEVEGDDTRIGEVFDRFLSLVGERMGKAGGAFFTPRSVNELIIRLADLRLGMVVGDFYAGVGGTLVAALAHVGLPSRGETPVSGADINGESVFLARVNLYLHGADPSLVRHEDTLTSWRPTDERGRCFDRVLSNPPFALAYDPGTFREPSDLRGRTSAGRAELMVVQQVLASLRPGGRAIVAMAHGPLFRGGQEQSIRRALLDRGEIEAVIGIGPNLFQGTAIPSCLLVLRRPEEDRPTPSDVLFVDAESEVATGRNQNRLEPHHIEKIVRVFDRRDTVPGFSRLVPWEEIARNSHSLHIGGYVDRVGEEGPVLDLNAALNGGVPPDEVMRVRGPFRAFGLDVLQLFALRCDGHVVPRDGEDYEAVAARLSDLCEPAIDHFGETLRLSWPSVVRQAYTISSRRTLGDFRQTLVDLFCRQLVSTGVLDEYDLAGVFAQCWAEHAEKITSRFYGERDALADLLTRELGETLLDQARDLVQARQRVLVDTVYDWKERYGDPLRQLWERSAAADRRFRERLSALGVELPLDSDAGEADGKFW